MTLLDQWPLFGLRISSPRLELRFPTDADLSELIQVAGSGVHDPSTMPFTTPWTDLPSPRFEREALQYWWRCRSGFTPESWDLSLAVVLDGQPIGLQNLKASDFLILRTAETGSWIGQEHQGQGIGTEMRFAALSFGFEFLEAHAITSTAFSDNLASQRVSLATGYVENGRGFANQRGRRAEQIRYQLVADRWASVRPEWTVDVQGFDECKGFFGLD